MKLVNLCKKKKLFFFNGNYIVNITLVKFDKPII